MESVESILSCVFDIRRKPAPVTLSWRLQEAEVLLVRRQTCRPWAKEQRRPCQMCCSLRCVVPRSHGGNGRRDESGELELSEIQDVNAKPIVLKSERSQRGSLTSVTSELTPPVALLFIAFAAKTSR